ncbi:TIGR03668 family PPOX class F420-dependent oxidoreductase [Actinacidiphila bryophytorum]|uniref:PPOX class F420-dependent oxidoreductase n=1 Tax=Actinacidiphila bryophytorum TaxID=1436133 RepID=A0A9W4E5N7_9ACTN|nr:TIGR03668 family PPOX class F420-dependent oxidoreductase [Actinacidiphila bryophytorum]MBM9434454.1 TIGR03668 family PPOX class F420-dependent oxidoreductase [Actinacidiphila bryophytorum]MBN6541928.1 TIGR03668 family PPOX class F420-dependent oxidoreductase [Actinacidiphila bryophytorum]CAG7626273.1 PPOX class F420-dependent oxidoreductase [Actinacidiphila bryophytorum]
MNLSETEARERFAASPVGRLATADRAGIPHVVPVTFAADGDVIYFAIDYKPKRSVNLRRLRNISENPSVAVMADHYADDWNTLWWARADGRAEILNEGATYRKAVELLQRKYDQYAEHPPQGPVVVIHVDGWTGWAFAG